MESTYNTPKAVSGELVDSLIGGSALNYVGHRECVYIARLATRCAKMHVELGDLDMQKNLSGGQKKNSLHMATMDSNMYQPHHHVRGTIGLLNVSDTTLVCHPHINNLRCPLLLRLVVRLLVAS